MEYPMVVDVASKREQFRALHERGCFVIPNAWDIGSAKRLERLGFKAIASTSSGSAWALGREDGELSRDEVLAHLRLLCGATDLPVNADFEAGFAEDLKELAGNVVLAIETGIAGLSIEDFSGERLYDISEATERIAAARDAINSSGENVLLVGRAEGFIRGNPNLDDAVRRLASYSRAGADCLYAPGLTDISAVSAIVKAVSPKPVNVLLNGPEYRVADLAEAGVRRVSVGGGLAAVAWSAFDEAAKRLRDQGTMLHRPGLAKAS